MVTKAEVISLIMQGFGLLCGVSVVTIAIAGFVSKIVADRSIERHKAQLGQETERLKGELAKETESHKFDLKKKEVLFGKELEAAIAYFSLYGKIEPRYSHPDKDWDEVMGEVVESFAGISSKIAAYLANHGIFLSAENRRDLGDVEETASTHQYTHIGQGPYNEEDSKLQAERVLNVLKAVGERFVNELRN